MGGKWTKRVKTRGRGKDAHVPDVVGGVGGVGGSADSGDGVSSDVGTAVSIDSGVGDAPRLDEPSSKTVGGTEDTVDHSANGSGETSVDGNATSTTPRKSSKEQKAFIAKTLPGFLQILTKGCNNVLKLLQAFWPWPYVVTLEVLPKEDAEFFTETMGPGLEKFYPSWVEKFPGVFFIGSIIALLTGQLKFSKREDKKDAGPNEPPKA